MSQYYEGIGRRKEATARVRISSGSGKFTVNEKDVMLPLRAAGEEPAAYDISVKVKGGGVSGQTDAVKLGLARALVKLNPEWNSAMRKGGLLTRDARIKERKKPGLKRARKAPTYTKR